MIKGQSVFGRLSHGLDLDEFDAQWPLRSDVTGPEGEGGDGLDQWGGSPESFSEGLEPDDEQYGVRTTYDNGLVETNGMLIDPYENNSYGEQVEEKVIEDEKLEGEEFSPPVEVFPLYKKALMHFQDKEPQSGVVRIDTPETYQGFVAEKACNELARRLNELRAVVEAHTSDGHGPKAAPLRKWDDVLGAVEAVKTVQALKAADTVDEATSALPKVELDLPDYAEGKVQCWRDGKNVIVSIKFADSNGNCRIATMAAKSNVNIDDVAEKVKGMSPMQVLGALPKIASQITGNRLLGEVAEVALRARENHDVCGMDGSAPVVRVTALDGPVAPLAALMFLQQEADSGNAQAQAELTLIEAAARTTQGRDIAAPMLAESKRLLEEGRAQKGAR